MSLLEPRCCIGQKINVAGEAVGAAVAAVVASVAIRGQIRGDIGRVVGEGVGRRDVGGAQLGAGSRAGDGLDGRRHHVGHGV